MKICLLTPPAGRFPFITFHPSRATGQTAGKGFGPSGHSRPDRELNVSAVGPKDCYPQGG